jgi:hypothetical protein
LKEPASDPEQFENIENTTVTNNQTPKFVRMHPLQLIASSAITA